MISPSSTPVIRIWKDQIEIIDDADANGSLDVDLDDGTFGDETEETLDKIRVREYFKPG